MESLGLVAILVLMVVAVIGLNAWYQWSKRRRLSRRRTWRIRENSVHGVTYVYLYDKETEECRVVGQVVDSDPDYDDKLLELRAKAQVRQAVVATR